MKEAAKWKPKHSQDTLDKMSKSMMGKNVGKKRKSKF